MQFQAVIVENYAERVEGQAEKHHDNLFPELKEGTEI
jgi:hypothetical protein